MSELAKPYMVIREGAESKQRAALLELDLVLTDFSRHELESVLLQADIQPLVKPDNRKKIEALWDSWQNARTLGALSFALFDEDTEIAIENDDEMRKLISKGREMAKIKVTPERKEAHHLAKTRVRVAIYGGRLATYASSYTTESSEKTAPVRLESAS